MKIKLSILAVFFTLFSFAQNATISGIVTDKDLKDEALPFANVTIKGTSTGATTDMDGKYAIDIPAGNHIVVFSFLGYVSKEIPFIVMEGEKKTINQSIGSGSVTMKDVVVKATISREKETALLLDQKKAVEIKQSIGAQEMARKGVSNVESGLTKITGISKVDGRGLFVRGLEERYNNLLINDLQAPSSSPFKKIVPLDLFPTDIVGVLNVYKTFNPNISGDFAGATINIETAQPRSSITKLTTGFGYVTGNNNEDFLISENANTTQGFLGFIGKDRKLPEAFGKLPSSKFLSVEQYNESAKQNSWDVNNSSSPINNSIGFLHSEKFSINEERNISYIFSVNADNKYQIQKGVDRTFFIGQGDYDNNLFTSKYSYNTTFSGLAGLKYKSKRFGIAINSFLLKSTASIIQDQLGDIGNISVKENLFIRENKFEESKYWNNQVLANYDITENGNHTINGGFSYSKTSFGQPDRKFIRGEKLNDNDYLLSFGGNNFIRQFLDISGNRFFSSMVEYNLKFKEKTNGKSNKLSFGYNGFSNEEISTYRFVFGRPLFSTSFTTNINNIDEILDSNINSGLVRFGEESTADFRTKLFQNINSGYANAFFNFGEKWEINGGVRVEKSLREIKFRFTTDAPDARFKKIEKDNLDILPSLNVKYVLNDKNNIRFAGSKTLTRPTSIEVMPITYINPDGTVEVGNPNIENSDNINIDLKYELFPSVNEMIAVGVFGKQITNPIERIFIPTASSGGQITTYQNSKRALLYGVELEFSLQLNRISSLLDKFSFGFNTSLMKTNVEVNLIKNPLENSNKRPLQGASNWLINSDLKYDFQFNEEMKNSMSLVYGVAGERIFAVGTAGLDHVYEKPFSKLDFVWSSRISKNIDLKMAVDNILNPSFRKVLGNESKINIIEKDLTVREFKRGTGYSLNISYTF
ncbi:TonB-dependent receptor domain-containing protein [Flavobacterium sp.]|uniref:TonB-dependent receptor n=1 Tax=Flavobacterium sp. TaxID=239 RepID=UPI00286C268C|nr:TonB-dependent receptor [Flavobacterium sp.]